MIQNKKDDSEREVTPYEVAQLVCLYGYTPNTIARKLFREQYENGQQAQAITKTKRLLKRAVRERIVQLVPPKNDRLTHALDERYPLMRSFSVIDDGGVPGFKTKGSPVFAAAAHEISERIKTLVRATPPDKPIIIANAGGVTLGQVIEHLGPIEDVLEGADRLRFISLNGARRADEYQYSANFLAAQMAQMYGGSHTAVINVRSPAIDALYKESLENVDLVLTSTGTRSSFLFLWHEEELKGGYPKIDERAVGDISFVLIDKDGEEVPLEEKFHSEVQKHLRPRPTHRELVRLARQGKVFVVSAQLPPVLQKRHAGADYSARARARVAHAVCEAGLASDCVLGSTVAELLVDETWRPE